VTNNGPSVADNVFTTDTLPVGTSYVSGSASPAGTVTNTAGVVVADLGDIVSGNSVTITITVDATAVGVTGNTAVTDSSTTDVDTTDNTVDPPVEVDVIPSADLSIVKTASTTQTVVGQPFTYEIVVTNNGPSDATNVVVLDDLPFEVMLTTATVTQGIVILYPLQPSWVDAIIGTIPADGVATMTLTVIGVTPGLSVNWARLNPALEFDPDLGNNDAPLVEVDIIPGANLSITKTASVDEIALDEQFTYEITVTNNGPNDAEDVFTTDTLPAGTSFTTGSATQGSVSETAGVVVADLGDIVSGDSVTITITVDAIAVGPTSNTASVDSVTSDVDTTDNTVDPPVEVEIVPAANLEITKTASVSEVGLNEQFTYTITVTNNGPSTAEDVFTTDTLPVGTSFDSGSASPAGTVSENAGVVVADLGDIASGDSVTITITVNADAVGLTSNTAVTDSATTDVDTTDNVVDPPVLVNIIPAANLEITKTASVDEVGLGEQFTYEIVVTNNGPSTAEDVFTTDSLP
ncbi:MAG: hypothetical protein CVV34_04085, partial [Methanomicrobiales archaeon HGW-Methanomicrobiales-5]